MLVKISPFLVVISSFFLSWMILGRLIPYLRKNLMDQPNERSSHSIAKPNGGGIVFILMGTLFSTFSGNFIPLFCLPLAIIGLIDDQYKLSNSLRYSFQIFTVIALILYMPWFYDLLSNYSFLFLGLRLLFLVIVGTAIINFVNFMDGLDGLVAGCMAISIATTSLLLSSSYLALFGALLGFLIWNWSPAKVFMGDTGSTFLGSVFVGIIFSSEGVKSSLGFLFLATPLLADACICVIRRFLSGHSIFQPHRLHLYQRLNQAGWGHSKVASLYISATFMLALVFIFGGFKWTIVFSAVVVYIGFLLDKYASIPFYMASIKVKI